MSRSFKARRRINQRVKVMYRIDGIESMDADRLIEEIRQGGRFKVYNYCFSVLILTFRRPTNIIYVPPTESKHVAGLRYVLISLLFGWWGFPWGPIYTVGSLVNWLGGGTDLTQEILFEIETVFWEGFASPEQMKEIRSIAVAM